ICTASDGRPPVHIHIGGTRLAACKSIVQRAEIVDDDEAKFTKLKEKLHEMAIFQEGSTDKCIIFCRSRNGVIKLKDMLTNEDMVWRGDSGCLVKELHGELQQADRDWAMEEFRDGALPCVVATGVLARGHDIPQVMFVINYDMPRVAEDYIHRVGRTGRAGHTGYAFTFVNRSNWQELQWGHDYLLGVLQATEQNVDETLQEAIDAHVKAAEWKEDAWWEDAANWNSGSGYPVGEVVDVEFVEDDNVVLTENICALARKLVGEYVEHDVNHGKTIYKRSSNIEEMFLYYFDDGEDPQSMGWYFGTAIGGDDVFGWSESMETGWHVPHSNPDALAGLKVKRRQAAAWNTSDQQAIAQTSTEEYYEAGHGASAADFAQEVSGQTSTEAYLAQTGVTDPKEPSTLNSSAQEFTPQEYQNQAEWYSGQDGCFQGEIPAEMDYSEAAGCGWPQDPAAAAVGYDYEHYAADMSQAFYDQNAYCDQTAAMFEAAYDQSAYYDPAASTFEAADMSAFASSTQRPPPGLEEENALPASGCEVEAEPFVLAHDEVAMQVQPEALNGKVRLPVKHLCSTSAPQAPPQYEPPKFNAQQMSYLPQLPDSDDIPLTKEGIQLELQSASVQDWIRALANFQVLGSPVFLGGLQSQEQRPLWAKRIRALSMVPKLFQAITKVRTERGLTWEQILTVRQVLTKEGKVTVATGHDETYVEWASPSKIHGLVGALFQKMWAHQDFTRFFTIPELTKYENWKLYDMISSTLMAVYNHFCSEAGLTSRMLRRKYPELGVRIVHDAEAKIDPNTGLSKRSRDSELEGQPTSTADWSEHEDEDDEPDYHQWLHWHPRNDNDDDTWGDWGHWKEAEEPAKTSPDQDCTRTGLVDMEAEEPVDDTELVNAKPEEEQPVEAELQQVPQVPQEVNTSAADTEAEVAQPQAEQMPAQDQPAEQPVEVQPVESTPKAAELISEAEAEKPLDPEPTAEKAPADQASSKEGWSTFWDDGTGQDQEAKVEAVPDNCEVYNIDKNPESVEAPSADAASGLSMTSEADCKKAEDKPKDKHIEANPIAEEPAEPADTSTTDANAEGMAAETA
ncbi:RH40, partial [Symbiodinium microadriaticum]